MAINNHNSTSTGLSPFFVTHGYHVDPIQVKEKLRTDGKSPVARAECIVQRLQEATEWAQAAIASAQEQQEKNANTRRQPADQFKPGDKVWLRLRNVRSDRPCKKLDWLSAKYTVLETIGSHACRLDMPPGIHNVFHVSLLRLAAEDPLPSQTSDDCRPPAILTDDGELWEVEEILDEKKVGREWKVLVKWVGWIGPTWEPVKYVADTIAFAKDVNKVIEFDGHNHTCEAMSDASFADDHRDRKSTQGYAIKLFGGPVVWKSGKQDTVTTSSTEAELLALSQASKELLAFHRLCKEITLDLESKDPAIQCDNQQTIRLLTQEMVTLVTKLRHVDIHHHWLRQEVQNGNLQVDWVPTAHMAADGLTKALQGQKFAEFQRQIGLVDLPLQN
ncbi:hypothetical protein HIM_12173 [Hirsutella minnesotensis 3608]|uniref:Chromo domain-containing protein n=1 Tax=Hirsutella minnesotensis 3608 TaxID=1043627 RepID=A0A0F7ZW66_9HYPO|nr:hypothetical protein HIM_12173 [Hirsutella minnesotensis 3608]